MFITDSESLKTFCDAVSGAPYVCVDTEFIGERSYLPELCLVQVAYGEHVAVVDTLCNELNLRPLKELLLNQSIVKVFHAARQDLEIFLEALGELPAPVFDTQIAAAVCGHGEQPGYAKLVNNMLGIELDKASQITNWSLRPLTDRQLEYAAGDVTHLCKVYELLLVELESSGRSTWIRDEMARLQDKSRYVVDPQYAYKRVKVRRPKAQTLAVLRELAAWREQTARSRKLPRPWVIRDESMVEIAQSLPKTMQQLTRVRKLKLDTADCNTVLELVVKALEMPSEQWPVVAKRAESLEGHESLVALLQALLRLRCEANGVSMKAVASRADLDRLATEKSPDIAALSGWRLELFGNDALALKAGRLALTGAGAGVADLRLDD